MIQLASRPPAKEPLTPFVHPVGTTRKKQPLERPTDSLPPGAVPGIQAAGTPRAQRFVIRAPVPQRLAMRLTPWAATCQYLATPAASHPESSRADDPSRDLRHGWLVQPDSDMTLSAHALHARARRWPLSGQVGKISSLAGHPLAICRLRGTPAALYRDYQAASHEAVLLRGLGAQHLLSGSGRTRPMIRLPSRCRRRTPEQNLSRTTRSLAMLTVALRPGRTCQRRWARSRTRVSRRCAMPCGTAQQATALPLSYPTGETASQIRLRPRILPGQSPGIAASTRQRLASLTQASAERQPRRPCESSTDPALGWC